MTKAYVVMICTAARGGMRAVVEGYEADGLFGRWNVVLLNPHQEGRIFLKGLVALFSYLRFLVLLLTFRVSLVHCHSAMKGSFWRKSFFSLTARLFSVPVIFHLHGSEMKSFVGSQPQFLKRIIGWILERQSRVVVLSNSWAQFVVSIAPNSTVVVLPNYVNLPLLPSENKCVKLDSLTILFLGLIGHRKGVYDLLHAFRLALENNPKLKLVIGGNGEVDKARFMALELGISESVTFVGWVSGEDKLSLLRQADIFVLPSHNEGLPVSLLEAMSWQLPVISTRIGGIPELVRDGIDGILIDPGDQGALSAALICLAQNHGLRGEFAKNGRGRVEVYFSKQVVLPKLDQIYSSLIQKNL